MKFEIKGTDQLIQKLHNSMNMDRIKEVVRKNGAEMENKMKRNASFKGHWGWVPGKGKSWIKPTGETKRSIKLNIKDNGLSAHVAPTTKYSPYLEYGTRKMSAQPFVRPSYHEQKQQFIKDMKRVMK